jgi:hypothetical protein
MTDRGAANGANGRYEPMSKTQFRVTNIALDDEEEVSGVTAIVRDDAYGVMTSILGRETATATARGGTEMTVNLSVADMATLYGECGRMNDFDPRSDPGGNAIYNSMLWIHCTLMGE